MSNMSNFNHFTGKKKQKTKGKKSPQSKRIHKNKYESR